MADGVVPPQLGCAVVGVSLPAAGMAAARARHTGGSATGFSSVDRSAINFKHSLDILWDEGSMLMEGFQKLLLIKRPISYWI
jgi:hypothetical protein